MMAIAHYTGLYLLQTPDIPRRWTFPRSRISLKAFRRLLRRRSKALSLLQAGDALASTSTTSTIMNQNRSLPSPGRPPLPPSKQKRRPVLRIKIKNAKPRVLDLSSPMPNQVDYNIESEIPKDRKANDVAADLANLVMVVASKDPDSSEDKLKENASNDKKERKKEVEEKLEIPNKKKHNLYLNDSNGKW